VPLLLVLILVLIAFGLLLVGFLTSNAQLAWVSVLVSVAAFIVLVVDALQRRAAVRAGDEVRPPSDDAVPGADRGVPVAPSAPRAVPPGARAGGVPEPFRPVAPRPSGALDPVTEVLPVVRPDGRARIADAERTVVMPVVRPSGSPSAPPGAPAAGPPSRESSSLGVTRTGAPPPDATVAVPAAGPVGDDGGPPPGATGDGALDHPVTAAAPAPGTAPAEAAVPPVGRGSSSRSPDAEPAAPPDEAPAPSDPGPPGDPGPAGPDAADGPDAPPADAPPGRTPEVEARAPEAEEEPPVEPPDADAAALVARLEDEVLVIDERPRYHVPGCRTLPAAAVIPLPAREAVELGFTPCGWCTPDRSLAARHAPARS
jgi:hypothetical protein